MNESVKNITIFIGTLSIMVSFTSCVKEEIDPKSEDINSTFVNNMESVLGDEKQAFIHDKLNDVSKFGNLLKDLKGLKVNEIRIPIFTEGLTPSPEIFDYFYRKETKEEFLLFANPALHGGGKRIPNGLLFSDDLGEPVKDVPLKTQLLINRIFNFSENYTTTWINPFNEDAKTGDIWSAEQVNTIYSILSNKLNNVELIGSCVWGIPACIKLIQEAEMATYIIVAISHLKFNHERWPEFIQLAKQRNIPIWDSGTNNNDKYATEIHIQAAINAGVDVLVLHSSWNVTELETGEINEEGKRLMNIYLT